MDSVASFYLAGCEFDSRQSRQTISKPRSHSLADCTPLVREIRKNTAVQICPWAPKRRLAQSGSATALGAVSRGFKSLISDFFNGPVIQLAEILSHKEAVTGSYPVGSTNLGAITQMVECLICIQNVAGSIPVSSTKRM